MQLLHVLLGWSFVSSTKSQTTYQFPVGKDPYKDRNHVADSTIQIDLHLGDNNTWNSPYVGHIFYPDAPGRYPWVDFFGGLFGTFPTPVYLDLISEIVQMGFVLTYRFSFRDHLPRKF